MDFLNKNGSLAGNEFAGYTEGFAFPATRDDIIAQARRKHIPEDVVSHLQALPDRTFDSVSDLIQAVVLKKNVA